MTGDDQDGRDEPGAPLTGTSDPAEEDPQAGSSPDPSSSTEEGDTTSSSADTASERPESTPVGGADDQPAAVEPEPADPDGDETGAVDPRPVERERESSDPDGDETGTVDPEPGRESSDPVAGGTGAVDPEPAERESEPADPVAGGTEVEGAGDRPAVYGDRYELRQLIATGGMAEVFLAHDRLLDRPVAVKRLYSQFAADSAFVERFEREAKAVAKLNHPNIVSVYDWGVEEDTQYLVMEYVEGRSLAEILQAEGRLHPDRAADIAIDVAAALTLAHREGMVHKDVKAGNIMITTDGRVQVLDFGIARAVGGSDDSLTDTGTVMGTATYFSPEQAQGLQVGPRGDLYSLGVVLFEMTVGQPPFTGKTPVAIAYQHVRDQPPKPTDIAPDVPVEIEAITLKLLAKDPDDRYPTAEDLRADLRRYREGHRIGAPVVVAPEPDPTPLPEPAPSVEIPPYEESPRRTGVFLFFMIVVLLVVTAGLFLWAQTLSNSDDASIGTRALVPDVVGESADQAEEKLRAAGFEVTRAEERSDTVTAGLVIRQDPREGTEQDEGITVTITVSTGTDLIRLPNVVSLTDFGATQDLEALGFEVRRELREDTTVPEGIVIEQSPAAGTEVEAGSAVIITVSQGSTLQALPDVAGLERQGAEDLLGLIGCVVTEVRNEESADVTAGQVIRTDPPAGTGVDPDACSVVLFLSTGAGAQDPNAAG